jgi:Zn-dependent M28 family amino/carboxypeptidase
MPAPRRSVVFIATTAEENGLLGADYYGAHPLFPIDKTAAVVNMDAMNVYGPVSDFNVRIVEFTDAMETVRVIGESIGLELNISGPDTGGGNFRMDHFPLCARGLVALSVSTGRKLRGVPEEEAKKYFDSLFKGRYHQPSDEFDPRWRYDGTMHELQLLYLIGRHWADGAARATLKPDNPFVPAIRMKAGAEAR